MNKILNYFYSLVERIGKRNVILIVFIILIIVITSLYQTFSLYTASNGVSIIDGLKTYKFILGENQENSVSIAKGSSKNIAITVSNQDKMKLKYGVYYSSSDYLSNVDLGYKYDTEHLPNGTIEANQDYIVTIEIENNSSSDITIHFGVIYGLENGGDLILDANQYFLEKKWNFPLNEVNVGSYVKYVGNNGCVGKSCEGQNANYVDDAAMGYCYDSGSKFFVNGWRIGYIKNDSAYLISAGAPECLCTNSDGTSSSDSCSTYDTTNGTVQHLANLNNAALKYCNPEYVYGGVCDRTSSWNMNAIDFKNITGSSLSSSSCYQQSESTACGYGNDLIDNGSWYWYATSYNLSYITTFYWHPWRSIYAEVSKALCGIRPVLRLDPNVLVIGGTGTYQDPYILSKRSS